MEISERHLRLLATDVDDQHRDGLATMKADIAELHAETRSFRATDRRSFLRKAGLGAGALTIGGSVLPFSGLLPAGAQELTDGDIAAFAESVELAAVEAYTAAAASGKLQPAVVDVGTMFAGHHQEHAGAFAGASGGKATGKPNAKLLAAVGDQLKGAVDQTAILAIAYDLEEAAAATYLFGLGALESAAALRLAASILPVESQHAVVIGTALGRPAADYLPSFQTSDKAVDPAKFPAA
ncbi:MAG TPA: ferritin-like domain-containing protein [Acidimicrobiales bacterium]|nr:ferritin-like domain-containing protein [Acidimicrobiales bacterium]